MAILNSDTFNRTGSSLGGDWTTQSGAFQTDGSFATVSTVAVHIATLAGTSQADTFLQCWMKAPDALNNACIIWRYQDNNNFYFLRVSTGALAVDLGKRVAGVFSDLASYTPSVGTGWNRFSVRHIGNDIEVYLNAEHDTTNEGPILIATDAAITAAGPAGIMSTDSNAGASFWNDFIVRDGEADTIYVDTGFNGGVVGEGMGTLERADLGIGWALNNCGTEVGSTIKLLSTTAIGTTTGSQFINHRGRWSGAYAFPTYDDADGRVTNDGSPNLIIEGADGATRTTLNETLNTHYFTVAGDSGGIVIRGFHVRLTGGAGSTFLNVTADADGGVSVDKCSFSCEVANTHIFVYDSAGFATLHRLYFNYIALSAAATSIARFNHTTASDFLVRNNVFDLRDSALAAVANAGVIVLPSGGAVAGDIDIDHNTFLEVRTAGTVEAAYLVNNVTASGASVFQNNIVYGLSSNHTGHGVNATSGPIAGSINAHHNGYYQVVTPRSANVTNGGNEQDSADPVFFDDNPATIFTWQHTAGRDQEGEGTFPAITIEGDFRPTDSLYVETADDSHIILGVLDRGALQEYEELVIDPEEGLSAAFNDNRKVIYLSYAAMHRKGAVLKASGPISVEAQDATMVSSSHFDAFTMLTLDHDGNINIEHRGDPPLPMVLTTRMIWGPKPEDRTQVHRLTIRHEPTLVEDEAETDIRFLTQAPSEDGETLEDSTIEVAERRFEQIDVGRELQNFKIQFEGKAPLHFWIAQDDN